MPFDINVFASGFSHRVGCHKDRTLVVTTYRDRMEIISKFSKQLPQLFGRLLQSDREMYSASVEEWATHSCLQEHQLKVQLASLKNQPV